MKIAKKLSPLILGTVILSAAGVLSRLVGFLYRIFLSRTIGASALGLCQLVFPVLTICYSVSSMGIQTAISKFVAGERSPARQRRFLAGGLLLSVLLSVLCEAALYVFSDRIAIHLLGDARCGALLRILSHTMLPASVHACINGYYFGKKQTALPALVQLIEQAARVGSVYLMYVIVTEKGGALTAAHAVWGIFFSELAGFFVSTIAVLLSREKTRGASDLTIRAALAAVAALAVPMAVNHTFLHLFSSVENLLIPQRLRMYGLSADEALSVYGVLSGMVLSILFFPGVLTNSVSVLLLPSVSEAAACGNSKKTDRIVTLAIRYGLLFGFAFTVFFLAAGDSIGAALFGNALCGVLLKRLSWLCPMMYLYGLLCSILHGTGHAKAVLGINLLASLMRIGMIVLLVPRYGVSALLWGMLVSQLFSVLAALIMLPSHGKQWKV